MTVATPSDRPTSVHNRCVIEFFGDIFVLSCCPFDISVGIRAFVIGLSHISSFFLSIAKKIHINLVLAKGSIKHRPAKKNFQTP